MWPIRINGADERMEQRFIQNVTIQWDKIEYGSYLRNIQALQFENSLLFRKNITFFVGEKSLYNVATQEEKYADWAHPSKKYHEKSHGESFLALAQSSFRDNGLYLLDEPEAALSPQRQLTLLIEISRLAKQGAQFIIASHSPILLGIPDAQILSFDDGVIHECDYTETESYQVTEMFINSREYLLKRLLDD